MRVSLERFQYEVFLSPNFPWERVEDFLSSLEQDMAPTATERRERAVWKLITLSEFGKANAGQILYQPDVHLLGDSCTRSS